MTADTSRTIFAKNLRRMIDAEGLSVRAWALARGLDVKLIDRLSKGRHAVTLDKLELIAQATGLQSWMLLLPDLEPGNQPEAPITEADRKMIARLRRLLGPE